MATNSKDNNQQSYNQSAGFLNIVLHLPVKGGTTQDISLSAPIKQENVLKYLQTLTVEQVGELLTIRTVNSSTSTIGELEFGE